MTTPGPVVEPENLPPQVVSTREEPFSLDFDLHRPLQTITDELTERVERAYLIRVLELPSGADRPLRCSLRSLAPEHQREAAPVSDR